MAEQVHLHIGAPKSGTTYLQSILWGNREALARSGVLVPGRQLVDYNLAAAAARIRQPGHGRPARTWRRLVDQTRDWEGSAILSAEWFCRTPADLVPRMLGAFGDAGIHVVYTARALVPLVTAAWQESLKTGHRESLAEFVAGLEDDTRRWSWRNLDPVRVLARWSAHLPPDQIHVVTLPPTRADPDALLRRFAEVVGIDADALDTSIAEPNESLSVEAAELVRRVAPLVDELVGFDDLPWPERYRWLRRYFSHALMAPLPGRRIALGDVEEERIRGRATQAAQGIRAAGYPVTGSLDDLEQVPDHPGAIPPTAVSSEALLDLAAPVMARLVADVRAATMRAEAVETELGSQDGSPGGSGSDGGARA